MMPKKTYVSMAEMSGTLNNDRDKFQKQQEQQQQGFSLKLEEHTRTVDAFFQYENVDKVCISQPAARSANLRLESPSPPPTTALN